MLTLQELQALLDLNARLTIEALRTDASTERIHELSIHRQVLKDCIIELLMREVA